MHRFGTVPILAVLFTASWLSGCKADSGKVDRSMSAQASTQPQAPIPKPSEPIIVCFGDSLTAGFGVDFGSSYPADMQRDLDGEGYHYRVLNMGVSGNTTKDGLERVQRVLAQSPALVVVEFGGNDGLRGLPIDQTQRNLGSIVEQLQSSGTKVVLAGITLPPDYGQDYITKFTAMYPAVARQYKVPLLPFIYKDVYNVPGDIQDDGIHATVIGNVQVAKNIEGLIRPLLTK